MGERSVKGVLLSSLFVAFGPVHIAALASEKAYLSDRYGYVKAAHDPLNFEERWGGHTPLFKPILADETAFEKSAEAGKKRNQKGFKENTTKVSIPIKSEAFPQSNVSDCGPSAMSPADVEKLVRETARKLGVDEELAAAVSWTESRYDQDRNSPAGARGAMQLMPDTATRFGVADVCDTPQNIEGGIKYLRTLLEEFPNPLLAIAAYNSGENRIYQYGGIPPFQETVSYVSKVFNRQLGVEIPKPKASSNLKPIPAAKADGEASGVIPVNKNGKFVAGIMHF